MENKRVIDSYCDECGKETSHIITEYTNKMGELYEQEEVCSECNCKESEIHFQEYPDHN